MIWVLFLFAGDFSFVVIGDNRPNSVDEPQPAVFVQMIEKINSLKPKPAFVINVGDMIRGYVEDMQIVKNMWSDYLKVIARLSVKIYHVPGNHDVWNLSSYRYYKRIFGKDFYSFDYDDNHFVILNSSIPGQEHRITGAQFRWLKEDLKKSELDEPDNIFVFVHMPLFPKYHHVGSSLDKYPAERDRLYRLLVSYDVKFVFVGHNHFYRVEKTKDGLIQITTGGGGAPLYQAEGEDVESVYHFLLVNVSGEDVSWKVFKFGGANGGQEDSSGGR